MVYIMVSIIHIRYLLMWANIRSYCRRLDVCRFVRRILRVIRVIRVILGLLYQMLLSR